MNKKLTFFPPLNWTSFRRLSGMMFILLVLTGLLTSGCQRTPTRVTPVTPVTPAASSLAVAATARETPLSPATPTATALPTAIVTTATPTSLPPFDSLPLSQTRYILPLTVRHVTEESAELFFELEPAAEGFLFVRPLSASTKLIPPVPLNSGTGRHQILVASLSPGSEYEAIVALNKTGGGYEQPAFQDSAWGSVRFHTQPVEEPLRVGVIGDSGFGEDLTARLAEQMAALEPHFVLHTGDVVYRIGENTSPVEAFALKFYQPFSAILHRAPVYSVPGNHEYERAARWQGAPFYYYAFPPLTSADLDAEMRSETGQYYAAAYGDVQFLLLDSEVFFGVEGRQTQDAWLVERLSDERYRITIPVFHIPPFTSSAIHPLDSRPLRQNWHPLFTRARVPLVLSGHDHNYECLIVDNITYIVSGGGSSALYPAGEILPQSQYFAARSHFVLLEIYTDRIEISAIDPDGEVFDRAVVTLE